ncbi:MAG: YfbM family protein [Myxococcales bacterium]|nr:YfbM family protein [Myxococcales bacterium]
MGLDMTYQAFPRDTGLIELIRAHVDRWDSHLWQIPAWSLPHDADPTTDEERWLLEQPAVQQVLQRMPDPRRWRHRPRSRSQGKLEWILATPEERSLQTYEERARTLPYRMVFGDRVLADHAKGGQGLHVRMASHAFVMQAADTLEQLDEQALRDRFEAGQMADDGVYKAHGNDTFDDLVAELQELTCFYRRVALAGFWISVQQD